MIDGETYPLVIAHELFAICACRTCLAIHYAPPVRPLEAELIAVAKQLKAVFMNETVMPAAKLNEIVEVSLAAVHPMADMVCVDKPRVGASRKATAAMTGQIELSAAQIDAIRSWIANGASVPTTMP